MDIVTIIQNEVVLDLDAEAPKDLRQKLKAIMQLSSPELNAMSQASFELAKTEGADKWSATMQSIYNTFVK